MFMRFEDLNIISSSEYQKVSLTCPNCNLLMTTGDKSYFDKYECCEACTIIFVHPNKEKWITGWRPPAEEINRMLKKKTLEPTYIMRGLKC